MMKIVRHPDSTEPRMERAVPFGLMTALSIRGSVLVLYMHVGAADAASPFSEQPQENRMKPRPQASACPTTPAQCCHRRWWPIGHLDSLSVTAPIRRWQALVVVLGAWQAFRSAMRREAS